RTGHKEWSERAPSILKCAEACCPVSFGWIAEGLDADKLKALLGAVGTKHHVVAFDFFPSPVLKASPLKRAILEGIPVILWPCVDPTDRAEIRQALDAGPEQNRLSNLSGKMKQFYKTDQGKWKVALFWDDPQEKPEKWQYDDEF